MISLECPVNFWRTDGGSETWQTVKLPSAAPYASRSELAWPNFNIVTAKSKISHPWAYHPNQSDKNPLHRNWTRHNVSAHLITEREEMYSMAIRNYLRLCSCQRCNAFRQMSMQARRIWHGAQDHSALSWYLWCGLTHHYYFSSPASNMLHQNLQRLFLQRTSIPFLAVWNYPQKHLGARSRNKELDSM